MSKITHLDHAEARAALEALIPVAFHGKEEVTTPVHPRRLTPAEEAYIHLHAMMYTPSTHPSRLPFVPEPWADTTLTYVVPRDYRVIVADFGAGH
jgi:hypothetical protein